MSNQTTSPNSSKRLDIIRNHKKLAIVVALILLAIVGTTVTLALYSGSSENDEPGSLGWKKAQYGAVCERGVKEGLDKNTTEYAICTRDLGYDIKAIESQGSKQGLIDDPSENTESTETTSTPSDDQLKASQEVGCTSLRATKLDDLIASNKQNGISEEDTRITYQSGIAQCDSQGF